MVSGLAQGFLLRLRLLAVCVRATMPSLKLQRLSKEFVIKGVRESVRRSALVAVAHTGHLPIADRGHILRTVQAAGGSVAFVKNSLAAKGLEQAGADGLVPLMRGKTCVATAPAEVPAAKALLSLSNELPDFYVLGALLNHDRILQVRITPRPALRAQACRACSQPLNARPASPLLVQCMEVERLSKLPPAEVLHTQMVSQMLPGSSLQVPNVAAYLVGVLQMHTEGLRAAAGGVGDSE